MAFSSGTFSITYSFGALSGIDRRIFASFLDEEFAGIATGLSSCLLVDGTSTVTANIPLATYRLTGVGDPVDAQDAATKAYVDSAVAGPAIPAFTDLTGQTVATLVESADVTITGATGSVWPVVVRGDGSPEVRIAGVWGPGGTVRTGDVVRLRLTSSASNETALVATLYAPGASRAWSVTTEPAP